ncbi:hypothetical protein GLOTRDRAFT_127224 [Gloeophyllum trabeum ATCC 11539]|uniref:Uncharacterized protein n=1 Tax=Gloeophyllum trabeum (strain ATCC 11539 / FP-39264 / Madison 617) TaxID=670483 RepID=S7QBV1_GLOTA|nr:uncharacterized protein GLOTRDRAFT_127224 [Gloeophyllum trabeum ATCC 11539]EPQ56822.1 hypothetical protein GLOTRDRAFT_127224 [Gloeophyllum trabeum ATCC 11539]
MSEPLPSGEYFIEAPRFNDGSFSSRPVNHRGVFVMLFLEGTPPVKWTFNELDNGNYTIGIEGRFVTSGPNPVILTDQHYEWKLVKEDFLPSPVGSHNYITQTASGDGIVYIEEGYPDKQTVLSVVPNCPGAGSSVWIHT